MIRRPGALLLLAILAIWAAGCGKPSSTHPTVHVLAAASLSPLLHDTAAQFHNERVVCQFAASSEVRRQVEEGAPADLIILADVRNMDALEKAGQLRPGSRRNLFRNEIVLAVPPGKPSDIRKIDDLPKAKRVAIGEPDAVPLGRYAKESLDRFDLWQPLQGHLVYGKDARVVASWVQRGEVDAGVVYRSDAKDLQVVAQFPSETHAPIVYPAALATNAANPDGAARMLAYLTSPSGMTLTRAHGLEPAAAGNQSANAESASPKP